MERQGRIILSHIKPTSFKRFFSNRIQAPTIGLPVLRRSELKKLAGKYKKMKALHKAQYEVAMYDNQVEVLKTIHKTYEQPIDWQKIANEPEPYFFGDMGQHEQNARSQRATYKPTLFDRWFRRIDKRKSTLDKEIIQAIEVDKQLYSEWISRTSLAKQVVDQQGTAYLTAIEQVNPFDDLKEYGSSFEIELTEKDHIVITFDINSTVVIPTVEKNITKTGRLSISVMSKTKYYDLYQEFVCSCMIRIARDIFSLVPAQTIVIHAMDTSINTSTGYNEKQTILSVIFPRSSFLQLDFNRIDCSDALLTFQHHMHFVRTVGFKPVEQLKSE